MNRALTVLAFATLLLGLPSSAFAAWEKVGESSQGDVYIDPSTLKMSGENVRIMQLVSNPNPSTKVTAARLSVPNSWLSEVEIRCRTNETRALFERAHLGVMGAGGVALNKEMGPWVVEKPGVASYEVMQKACGLAAKKKKG